MIYEERGESKKALQYSLLAAHVSPTDAEQWLHLAQTCLQLDDQFKALNCFCKGGFWECCKKVAKLNTKIWF